MRIGIDARLWNETGVGRYIRNLVWELQKIDKKNEYVLFATPKDYEQINSQLSTSNFQLKKTDIHWHTVEEQLLFHKVLENEYLDLMHFPYFSVPLLYTRPFVITIHDLIINHFSTGKASTLPYPFYYLKRRGYQYVIKQAAKRATKVITVSEATQSEIVQHLGVSKDKIVVTYEGVGEGLGFRVQELGKEKKKRITSPYFLYVGNAYPHKNLDRLMEAFSQTIRDYPDVKLLLIGKKNYFYDRLKEKVSKLGLTNNTLFAGAVSDAELAALYAHAEALILPSLMEGFGLPGLEAMQVRCLVLASDIPAFKEIYQEAALYFDPLDSASMNDTMQAVLKNRTAYKKKREEGLARVKEFSWSKMARATLDVYQQAHLS